MTTVQLFSLAAIIVAAPRMSSGTAYGLWAVFIVAAIASAIMGAP